MDGILIIVLLGIVEGVTEFLPVSSTGHLILAGALLGLPGADATFDIVIQLGAILAVLVMFRARFTAVLRGLIAGDLAAVRFARNVLLGFLPSAVVGAVAYKAIRAVLEAPVVGPVVVCVALIVGGVLILLLERLSKTVTTRSVEDMPWRTALTIGAIQCLSMVPGVSRSGATIMGALTLGVDRKTAADYSFFLAIPTMLGATSLALYRGRHALSDAHLTSIAIGFAVSFVVALIVIRWFVRFVERRVFAPFAWYRIIAGSSALIWLLSR